MEWDDNTHLSCTNHLNVSIERRARAFIPYTVTTFVSLIYTKCENIIQSFHRKNQAKMESERKPLLKSKNGSNNSYTEVNIVDEYEPFLHRQLEHPTSNTDTLFHLLKGNIGTGILAMPEAFKHSGLLTGLFGTLIIGFICTHCMHLLVKCSYELCRRQKVPSMDYSDVCYNAFKINSYRLRQFASFAR